MAPNLLDRNFYAEKPNQKWVTDVTEFSLFGQKMYLSPILDLHNGYLVSYTISDRPVLGMVTSMLEKALVTIPDGTGLILHSDQGWQYQHKTYQQMLGKKGIRQSMSRKGNCLDNAVMENFFGLLKSELLYLQEFTSIEHFKRELVDYLDYYNNYRIKAKLKGLPPAIETDTLREVGYTGRIVSEPFVKSGGTVGFAIKTWRDLVPDTRETALDALAAQLLVFERQKLAG